MAHLRVIRRRYEMVFHHLDGLGNQDGMLSSDEWVKGMQVSIIPSPA